METEWKAYFERLDRRFDKLIGFLEEMDVRNKDRFERLEEHMQQLAHRMERVEGRLERVEGRLEHLEHRMDRVEGRLEQLEHRMDRVENSLDTLDFKVAELIIGVLERLDSMALRIEQFETRVGGRLAGIDEVRQELVTLRNRFDHLSERVDRVEAAVLKLGARVDSLTDDMRQRFRVVNEQLARIAA